jgi:hypothetical protein
MRPYPVSFKFYDIPESAEPGGARPGGRAGRLGLEPDLPGQLLIVRAQRLIGRECPLLVMVIKNAS